MESTHRISRPVVLYVDDERGNLSAFMAAFRHEFDVHVAQSATEALDVLSAIPVDVLITDQRMPTITGIEFVRGIKESFPEVVKMILTGFADHEVVMEALNEGLVYRFFEKPWNQLVISQDVHKAFDMLQSYRARKRNLLEMRENLKRGVDSVNELLSHLTLQQDTLGLGMAKELQEILEG
ncbi:MAG: response regulator [Bacteroidetes bacterium]|nr:response regulator [Bacteroidota bacterium]MDA0903284.1 response regulator [Bacteroidota bacterium]MDA1242157.1 response regulator [Bacteroidota bacterium]